jgi:hypothetical protein
MKGDRNVLAMTPPKDGSTVKPVPRPASMKPEGGSGVMLATRPSKLKGCGTFKNTTRPEGGIVKKTTRPEGGSVMKPGTVFAKTPPEVDQE